MASSRPNSLASAAPHSTNSRPDDARAYIDQLSDELSLEEAVLASLDDLPESDSKQRDIAAAKARIAKIKLQLTEARRKVSTQHMVDNTQVPRSPHDASRSSLGIPSRKRAIESAYLDVDPSNRGTAKRSTPSPGPSPFDGFEDEEPQFIDLTGDNDNEWRATIQRQKEAEERARQNKDRADRDAEIARQLHGRPSPPPFGPTSLPPSQQHLVSRQVPTTSSWGSLGCNRTGHIKQEPTPAFTTRPQVPTTAEPVMEPTGLRGGETPASGATSGWHPSRSTVKPEPSKHRSRMPGEYADSDDESEAFLAETSGQSVGDGSRPSLASSGSTFPLSSNFGISAHHLPSTSRNLALHPACSGVGDPRVPEFVPARQFSMAPHGTPPAWPQVGAPGGNPAPSLNGYSSSPANSSLGISSLGSNRPGFISNGGYYSQPGPSVKKEESLSTIIKRTKAYDYETLTDGEGNFLDSRLAGLLHDYAEDPSKSEIKQLLSNIIDDMDIPEQERGETPEAMKYPLYAHQQFALKWMTAMEEGTNKGGILADDMGLGKTISTLALMVSRPSAENIKTNLIIGPVALIKQWELEVKKKLKGTHKLNTLLLHAKKRPYSEIKRYDVVLTTYGSLAAEWKRYTQHVEQRKEAAQYREEDDMELARKCPLLHARSKFYRVILDEAQCVKNKDTQASRAVHHINATYRWCLTGTPMMNGVSELYPLIRFLRIRPYCEYIMFQRAFRSLNPRSGGSDYSRDNAMRQLQAVLKAMMLRRMKNSMIDGKPILTLPPKTENSEYVVFSDDERQFYQDLESKSQVQFNKYLRAGTVGKNYSNILVLLLRLRQACCHPHLTDFEASDAAVSDADALTLAKELSDAVIRRIKAVEAFECPICYDGVEDPLLVIPCGHDTCTECFASLTEKIVQDNIRLGYENGAARCPVCRGPVEPTKVITLTTFRKVHAPEALGPEHVADGEPPDSSESTYSSSDGGSESDAEALGNLAGFVVPDEESDEDVGSSSNAKFGADSDAELDAELDAALSKTLKNETSENPKKRKKAKHKRKDKPKAEEVTPNMLKELRLEADKNKEARRRYMHYLRDNWEDSAKVSQVVDLLEQIQETDEKTIVFSQWTALLDLIECQLRYKLKLGHCRYTGKMSRNQRDAAVQEFLDNPRCKVMLVSLRAGNAGLNLTVASRIIICDPFWNPFIEMQAVDRAHRIGQQREVKVHRILVKETIEDRILQLQENKRGLVEAALDEGQSRSLARLSERELAYLFGVEPSRR